MQALRSFFSPSGRLPPRAFVSGVMVVYLAGTAAHLLTMPAVLSGVGLWPFIAVQALLVWTWFVLHAKRLQDAGRPVGLAVGVSILYALSVVLLIIIAASFYNTLADQASDANTTIALGLILLVSIVAVLLGSPHYDLAWLVVAFLLLIAFVPVVLAVVVTAWAATRPSAKAIP